MRACCQTENQSVLEHGISVKNHLFQLINALRNNDTNLLKDWKIPDWVWNNRKFILNNLYSDDVLKEYTVFHDCGKPYCQVIDENNKQHFPNHAEISYQKWVQIDGNIDVANLIRMDMDIHLLKNEDISEFCKRPEAITLLLTGFAEIHSNAQLFGGIDSTSFKIKYKHLDRRGKAILKELGELNVIDSKQ